MDASSNTTSTLLDEGRTYLTNNYRQAPLVVARGVGPWIWDVEGRRYLDMTAGVAVSVLGHAHPRLVAAIADQAAKLLHVSNLFYSEPQLRFAASLVRRSFADRVFFCNSGAEANEAALKLARRYQAVVRKEPERVELVAFDGSFHGRTSGAVSLTGQPKYREGFGPLVGPVTHLPFGDVDAARAAITSRTCAVFVEPIQGEGGVRTAPRAFFEALRAACDTTGAVLVFDEVQTGLGRTGRLFAHERLGVVPDVMTLAKGIAGGVPMGAMLAREELARAFEPGTHASTFGGNPLACAAGLAVLAALDEEGLVARAESAGQRLGAGLAALAEKHAPLTVEARGEGLLRGLLLAEDATPYVARCRERGLLVTVAGGRVLRFAPPLVVADAEIDEALHVLDAVLSTR